MKRHISMDAMRGFAVMGILVMNILAFALPENAIVNPKAWGTANAADLWAWALSTIFVDGKMRGLFSLLFGVSMMLIIERAEAKGENAKKVHFARMFWLLIFGLLHYFFIWWGDILFLYAIGGCVAWMFRHQSVKSLFKIGAGIFVTSNMLLAIIMGSIFFVKIAAEAPRASKAEVSEYAQLQREFDEEYNIEEVTLYQGSYSEIVQHKMTDETFGPLNSLLYLFTETLPLMLFGMALMKSGFFTGGWSIEKLRKYVYWGIGAGGILSAILAMIIWQSGFEVILALNAYVIWFAPMKMMMTFGYAACLMLFIHQYAHGAFMERVAAAGRMTFSNYIGTSILMTSIFYGYGGALFGEVPRAMLYFFVLGGWAVMLLWSKPWLLSFHYGPLEWLWRSLSRGAFQPMKK
ncbi:hypothetical protein LPB140_00740 [Sphingorhabdus lutea]|uniref:DUF418 domain-containing protein n=2 Tax=Sphingorhabdus lutea TaxID=1913578 RepID=A0A1L3JE54_9SPHN|nr:hypothetical protein LPB140_00740 [Sphingorhabdus lutea]